MNSDKRSNRSAGTRNDGRNDGRSDDPRDGAGDRRSDPARDGERRSNSALADVVDQGIRFDAERGAALAWAYLSQHGLPPETILRVLSPPADGRVPRRAPVRGQDGAGLRH
ncbi:hypothetical protein IP92_03173 [Pseudoduganella flava]|uniref:Uncharacterized protein n=1 Tax=Pseudoduganella flava TaxID=871742 RepID=A0A562PRM3_9BURK|nr:hypothetical protein [Pseudoduganella flava]QGZ37966.1 hypothetical protein GO485_02150 [Pseudoduganella flava]TWI46810.1 hypothetical protein IP92_03173 [Pseudoduganella flava]